MTTNLLTLPPELLIQVFTSLRCMRDVIAFRLTCQNLNAVFQANSQIITTTQRDRLVYPIDRLFTLFASLIHTPLHYKPPDDSTFATSVASRLPRTPLREQHSLGISKEDVELRTSCAIVPEHDLDFWRRKFKSRLPKHMKNCIQLTALRILTLDVMHGVVYDLGLESMDTSQEPYPSWELETFVEMRYDFMRSLSLHCKGDRECDQLNEICLDNRWPPGENGLIMARRFAMYKWPALDDIGGDDDKWCQFVRALPKAGS